MDKYMDLVRLRTLTRKSKIGYGKFKDQTVGELLDANYKKELAWLYYHVQWITFMPDILEQLHITGKMVIEKPGVDHDKFEASNDFALENVLNKVTDGNGREKVRFMKYHRDRKSAMKREKESSKAISKGRLQAMNHGHISNL